MYEVKKQKSIGQHSWRRANCLEGHLLVRFRSEGKEAIPPVRHLADQDRNK